MNATASPPVVYVTPMQRRIYDLARRGLSDRDIAERAGLPGRTVRFQIECLKESFRPYIPANCGPRWLVPIVDLVARGELRIDLRGADPLA